MPFRANKILWDLLTNFDKSKDIITFSGQGQDVPVTDWEDKGLIERFLSILSEDLANRIFNRIDNVQDICFLARTCESDKLDLLEQTLGLPFITTDEYSRRNIIYHFKQLYTTKSTYISYNLMFQCLGYGRAKPIKVYDDVNTYAYYLNLIDWSDNITSEQFQDIIRATKFLEPLFATLVDIRNSDGDVFSLIQFWIDENGDLNYETRLDVSFELTPVGDLTVTPGPNFDGSFELTRFGDLIRF